MVDQDPNLRQQNLKQTSFFDPDAPEEVIRLFEKYVNAKWPLRVYAIEPVIAQQNVADAFGRRTQSAIELAASAPVSPFKVLSGLAVGRPGLRASVGRGRDGHPAQSHDGRLRSRRKYLWMGLLPRIQTRARDGRLLTDIALLLNGRFPDPTGKEQSIEPGQRECTALIVMPNFVPKIEFITVANWFRTSEVGDGQKSDLEKSSTLARKLVVAENALNRASIEGQYRPEEYQIALQRLSQIKSMMPTQRLQVSVPYTDDNNDSRIFCSQGGQLRPSLLAWHGRPPAGGGRIDDPHRGQELQRPRHPRDRRRQAGRRRCWSAATSWRSRSRRTPAQARAWMAGPCWISMSPLPTGSRINCSSRCTPPAPTASCPRTPRLQPGPQPFKDAKVAPGCRRPPCAGTRNAFPRNQPGRTAARPQAREVMKPCQHRHYRLTD